MDISKKLLTLLAIFCVIASAGVVCAEDVGSDGLDTYGVDEGGYAGSQYDLDDQGGYAGSQYNETQEGGYAGSQYQDEGGWAGSQYNETVENAAGEPVNETVNATAPVTANATSNATGNATANATAPHSMLATGNPILVLLAVGAVLGGAAVITRRK